MQAQIDLSIMVGWQVERMAREGKRLTSLEKYLVQSSEESPETNAADLRAMFGRMAAKQAATQ